MNTRIQKSLNELIRNLALVDKFQQEVMLLLVLGCDINELVPVKRVHAVYVNLLALMYLYDVIFLFVNFRA